MEHDPLEGDLAARRLRQEGRLGRRDDVGRRLQQLHQALRGARSPLQIADHLA